MRGGRPQAGYRVAGAVLARPVMALAPISSGPRRCKASTPPTSNASLRRSPRACGRTTSTSKCGQSLDSSRLMSCTDSRSITERKAPPRRPGDEARDQGPANHSHVVPDRSRSTARSLENFGNQRKPDIADRDGGGRPSCFLPTPWGPSEAVRHESRPDPKWISRGSSLDRRLEVDEVFLAVLKAKREVILVQGLREQFSATTGGYSRLQVGGWRASIRPPAAPPC